MSDRYARVYFDRIARDPKFDAFRNDHASMGSWLLLLIEAEKAWPAPAFRPPTTWVPARHFRLLVDAGIVDVEPDGRYRVHGLDSARSERSTRAKEAADKRWGAASNADGNAVSTATAVPVAMPNGRAGVVSSALSHSLSSVEGGVGGDDGRPDLEAFLLVRYRNPTPKQRELMDAYVMAFDVTGPQRAADLILQHPDDPIGALKADLSAFRAQRIEEAKKVERPAPTRRRRNGSGFTGVNAEIFQAITAQYAADDRTHRHRMGEHATSPDPACPSCQAVVA